MMEFINWPCFYVGHLQTDGQNTDSEEWSKLALLYFAYLHICHTIPNEGFAVLCYAMLCYTVLY